MLPKRFFSVNEISLHLINACLFSLAPPSCLECKSLLKMPELMFVDVCKCDKTLFRSVDLVKLSFQSGLRVRKKNREIASNSPC